MKRFTIRVVVGVLTFAIGVAVWSFLRQPNPHPILSPENTPHSPGQTAVADPTQSDDFVRARSDYSNILGRLSEFVFIRHSIEKVIRTMTGSFAKPSRLPNQVIEIVLKDACSSGCSEKQIAEYRRSIKTELRDLNADNFFELFIYIEHRDFCGIGFNCNFWIFQRQRSSYRLLLKDYPVVRIGTDVTMGFKNLESRGRMGSCLLSDGRIGNEIYLIVFKWSGNEYKPQVVGAQCRPR